MKLIVNPHKIEIDKSPVNEREIDITKCEFEFADEITNNYVKEAYFTFDGTSYKEIIVNNQCAIPSEVLAKKGQVEIGVVAFLVENEEEIKRYNPSPAYFNTWQGSLKNNAENSEPITPSEMEQYEQALQDGLAEVNSKIPIIDQAIEDANTAITQANNLDLDVSKEGKVATVTLTKKDTSTKVVTLSDGTNLMFNWDGTKLGIKTDEDEYYQYVDLQGVQGETGPMGAPFTIKKTYSSVAEMNADFNNMQVGDYVMITSTVELEDNAKLYSRGETQWIFITDFSGATGIQGPVGLTPNIQIGTVTSGEVPSVTRTGTNENPVLNFVLEKGEKGDKGNTGDTGATGNGIASITKTSTSGLVDTYTITYTDNTTSTFEVTNGEDGEVTQEQLDKVQAELDKYKTLANILPRVSGTGTDISLENTGESTPLEIDLEGQTSQESTTGKNLFGGFTFSRSSANVNFTTNKDGSITMTGTANATTYSLGTSDIATYKKTLEAGTYTLSGGTSSINLVVTDTSGTNIYNTTGNASVTFTLNNSTDIIIRANVPNGIATNTTLYPMLETGSSATSYEPYTGGIPAPNPSYPYPIKKVSGDNNVTICGKNLVNQNNAEINKKIFSSGAYTSPTGTNTTDYIYIGNFTNITIIHDGVDGNWNTCFFDENKNVVSGGGNDYSNSKQIFSVGDKKYIKFSYATTCQPALYGDLDISTYEPYQSQNFPITLGDLEVYEDGEFIKTTGKNLFNKDTITEGKYIDNSGNLVNDSSNFTGDYIEIDITKPYYANQNAGGVIRVGYYDSSKTFISRQLISANYGSLTIPENTKYVRLSCYNTSLNTLMLNEGSTALPYEPYGTGEWYLKSNMGKHIITNTDITTISNYWYSSKGVYGAGILKSLLGLSSSTADKTSYCTVSRKAINLASVAENTYSFWTNASTIFFFSSEFDTKEHANAKLVGATVVYQKETPTYTKITDTTLIGQLNNLQNNAKSYKDVTNISQTNDELPFIITASGFYDLNNILNQISTTNSTEL